MDKIKAFEKELALIKNPKIREFAKKAILKIPDEFFYEGASSTKKYHPEYAQGEGGLLRHTIAAVRVFIEILRMEMYNVFTEDEKDLLITALILHDTRKRGINFSEKHTVHEHPLLAANTLKQDPDLQGIISDEYLNIIVDAISSHMGAWTTNEYSSVVLPKPVSKYGKITHLADYLASRRCLEFNFDVEVRR